ncbi:hypothetical protein [Desulfolucanica intricata]|uniref:hypothetical protein n=1 Tax=Desulfolucanica intricata TaxID=1285191 RepID=UPI0008305A12|nr:hypothetical protein [Desulfolucanica intricata]
MKNEWKRLIAFFILGMFVGGVGINIKIGKHIDELIIVNQNLQEQLTNTEQELQQMYANLENKQSRVVSGIEIHVIFPEVDITKFEKSEVNLKIEHEVRSWLQVIQGEEVEKLNYTLIPQIIDERIVEVDNKKYKLKTKLIVILEKVRVYLEAVEIIEEKTTG